MTDVWPEISCQHYLTIVDLVSAISLNRPSYSSSDWGHNRNKSPENWPASSEFYKEKVNPLMLVSYIYIPIQLHVTSHLSG